MGEATPVAERVEANGSTRRVLRLGIMCNGPVLEAWQARCLEHLLKVQGVEPALVILRGAADPPRRVGLRQRWRAAGLAFIYRALVTPRALCARKVDVSDVLGSLPTVVCTPERRGRFSEHFGEADLEEIRSHRLDVILRFGFGIIRGGILDAARFGVWSFHHGDEAHYRGGPPAFWEIYGGDPLTGAVLQRLTDRLDGGVILHKGHFRTISSSYAANLDGVKLGSADWAARVARDLLNGRTEIADGPPSPSEAPLYRAPTNVQALVFCGRLLRNYVAAQLRNLFRADEWAVGVVDAPAARFIEPSFRPRVRWISPAHRGGFLADPFPVRHRGELFVLAEAFDRDSERGRIVGFPADGPRVEDAPVEVLEFPYHASYPCTFEHDGAHYCVPETADASEVALFRAAEPPYGWERIATLLTGVDCVDPTVFRHGGRWWLLAGIRSEGSNGKLYGWHAEELEGPWLPHALNPLKTDVRSARPAGTPFLVDGVLYRPAQDGSRGYGGAVVINRVTELTPERFEEEQVSRVEPLDGQFPAGIHTLSQAGDRTLVDGKRIRFSALAFARASSRKLRKIVERGR